MKHLATVAALFVLAGATASAAPFVEGQPLEGQVLESIDAGSYTYLRLKTKGGETWAAISKTPIDKGARIVIHDPMLMTNFESKALNRTFDEIVFGSAVDTADGKSPAATYMAAHGGMGSKPQAMPVEKVAKATGAEARTVGEIYAQRGKLKGQTVAVRGKVVKFSADIMERNWVHLRDGSGSAADATNDLLVTTKETVKVGDVLVARGSVRTDAEFGAGYSYPVVVEGATFKK
jgi:hypothetical protein